ncbi:MAG: hypothetical protein WAW37_20845 [Syntrophobacteraceae bacterium]
MIKQTSSRILLTIAFVALMLTLPVAHLNAEPIDVNQADIKGLNQSEAPRLMAQATETRRSVTSSTTEAPPPTEERRSVTTSTSSTRSTAEAAAPEKPHCANQCRDQYDRSMTECNLPDHPHHKKCEKWAREREKECLETCYRK